MVLFLDNITSIQRAYHNIMLCQDAIMLEGEFSKCIVEVMEKRKDMFETEDSLLALAASGSADSIFYCTFIDILIESTIYKLVRYFEYGTLNGFFDAVLINQIADSYPYAVYNKFDVEAKQFHDASRFTSRRKGS